MGSNQGLLPFKSLLMFVCIGFGLFSLSVSAVTYTWVDDKGARHYSDKVPAKYKDRAKIMGGKKANVMQSTKVPRRSQRYQKPVPKSMKKPPPQRHIKREKTPDISPSQYAKMSCNQKWRAYGMSEQCFNECAGPRSVYRDRSIADCGHCTDLKAPGCKRR